MSDVDQIRKALKKAKLPDWVESTHVEPMIDHSGDAALRVLVVVRPDREEIVNDGEAIATLVQQIHRAVYDAGVALFPYTDFAISGEAA